MPRAVDASTLQPGAGRIPSGVVEDNSLRHPNRDTGPLEAHVGDPSRAHMAITVGVEDVANNFSSDEVEGALAELAGAGAAGRLNGLLTGGTFTSVGLVLTLDATTVLVEGTVHDLGGLNVSLVDNSTQFVSYDVSTLTLVTSPTAPLLSMEDILFAEVTTVGGLVDPSSSRDGRWFVLNIDRKTALTVRSDGSDFNQSSEANFVSMTAAFLWLELYATAGGADPMETHRIIVRGEHLISGTMTLPINNVILEGDGDSSFATAATLAPMFDLNGQDRVTFRDIQFVCNHPGSTAINDGAGDSNDLTVERCRFVGIGDTWERNILLDTTGFANERHSIRNSTFAASVACVEIERATDCRYEDLALSGTSGSGTVGLSFSRTFGGGVGTGRNRIVGCHINGFVTGIWDETPDSHILECHVDSSFVGIRTGVDANRMTITNCNVNLYAPDVAVSGTDYTGVDIRGEDSKLQGCHLSTSRVGWAATTVVPAGISLTGAAGSRITDTKVIGFSSDNGGSVDGYGVIGVASDGLQISNVTMDGCDTGVDTTASPFHLDNFEVNDASVGVHSTGTGTIIRGGRVSLSAATGIIGIHLNGAFDSVISDVYIDNPRAAIGSYGGAAVPMGISLDACPRTTINSCQVQGFRNGDAAPVETGAIISAITSDVLMISNVIGIVANFGIVCDSACSDTKISNCDMTDVRLGYQVAGFRPIITSSRAFLNIDRGLIGLSVLNDDAKVSDCHFECPRVAWVAADVPYGVILGGVRNKIDSSTVTGFNNTDPGNEDGVGIEIRGDRATVSNNSIQACYRGIANRLSGDEYLLITGNRLSGNVLYGIVINESGGASAQNQYVTIADNQLEDCGSESGIRVRNYREVTITGNTLGGTAGATTYGIDLAGADLVNRRCVNYVIANNNISEMGVAGIRLGNHVWNGTVSGNHVDNGIGDDTQVTADGILMESGSGFVRFCVVDSNTVWNSLRGIVAIGVGPAGNGILNTTISGNIIHHCAADVVPADTFDGAGGLGIGVSNGSELVISDNQIAEIGRLQNADGTTSAAPVGVNYSSQGIYCLLCNQVTVSGNSIISTRPGSATGFGRGIALRQRNATGILTTLLHSITNNTVQDQTTVMDSMILVEVTDNLVAGAQSIEGLIISNNNLREGTTGIALSVGLDSSLEGTQVNGNVIWGPVGAGVGIAALTSATITGIDVSNNQIRKAGVSGIGVVITGAGEVSRPHFNENTIEWEAGSRIAGTNGILFTIGGGTLRDVQVNQNTIVNPGTIGGGNTQGIGIGLVSGNGPAEDWQINDNNIQVPGTIGIALGGVELVIQATATINIAGTTGPGDTVSIDGTPIGGAGLTTLTAGATQTPGGLDFKDSGAAGSDTASALSLAAAINDSLNGLNGTVKATVVGTVVTVTAVPLGSAGNGALILGAPGIIFVVSGPTVGGVGSASASANLNRFQVNRNNLLYPGETGILVFTFDGNIRQFSLNENTITAPGQNGSAISATRGAGILVSAVESTTNVVFDRFNIANNRLVWAASDDGANSAYGIGFLALSANLDRVKVHGNTVQNSPSDSVFFGTRLDESVTAKGGMLSNIEISNNDLLCTANVPNTASTPHYAIGMWMVTSLTDAPHSNISIRDNNVSCGSPQGYGGGVAVLAFPSLEGGTSFQSLNIEDNNVTESQNGILVATWKRLAGLWPATPIMENVRVDNNSLRGIKGFGIGFLSSKANSISDDVRRLENISISGNQLSNVSTLAGNAFPIGILWDWSAPTINLKIDNNTLNKVGDPGSGGVWGAIHIGLGQGLIGTNPLRGSQNISVCGNQVTQAEGQGIVVGQSVFATGDMTWQNVQVNGNVVRDTRAAGIFVWAGASTLLNFEAVAPMDNISVSNNIISTNTTGNGITVISGQTGNKPDASAYDDTILATNLQVSNNNVSRITATAIAIAHAGTLTGLSATGNVCNEFGASGISVLMVGSNHFLNGSNISSNTACEPSVVVGSHGLDITLSTAGGFSGSSRGVVVSDNIMTGNDDNFHFTLNGRLTANWCVTGNCSRGANVNSVYVLGGVNVGSVDNHVAANTSSGTGPTTWADLVANINASTTGNNN